MRAITSSLIATCLLFLDQSNVSNAFSFTPSSKVMENCQVSQQNRICVRTASTLQTVQTAFLPTSVIASSSALLMSSDAEEKKEENKLPMLLDPGTKGGALFLSLILFIIPFIIYNIVTQGFGYDEVEAGSLIGVGFTVITSLAWASTYIFRVATKDMTYAKQLKDYENAVIAKRLEELDDDEVQALVEDIERDDF